MTILFKTIQSYVYLVANISAVAKGPTEFQNFLKLNMSTK
jgi:hypothetical protein